MLTTPELESSIGNIWESQSALRSFCKRLATAFKSELTQSGITFVAVNDGEKAVGKDGFNHPFGADLTKTADGGALWNVRDGMAFNPPVNDQGNPPQLLSTLTDSEITALAKELAAETLKIGKHVAFCNLYSPKAIEFVDSYNDLEVAMRCVRAWDMVVSRYIVRIDLCCKKLDQ